MLILINIEKALILLLMTVVYQMLRNLTKQFYAFNERTIFMQRYIYILNERIILIQRVIYIFNEIIILFNKLFINSTIAIRNGKMAWKVVGSGIICGWTWVPEDTSTPGYLSIHQMQTLVSDLSYAWK